MGVEAVRSLTNPRSSQSQSFRDGRSRKRPTLSLTRQGLDSSKATQDECFNECLQISLVLLCRFREAEGSRTQDVLYYGGERSSCSSTFVGTLPPLAFDPASLVRGRFRTIRSAHKFASASGEVFRSAKYSCYSSVGPKEHRRWLCVDPERGQTHRGQHRVEPRIPLKYCME